MEHYFARVWVFLNTDYSSFVSARETFKNDFLQNLLLVKRAPEPMTVSESPSVTIWEPAVSTDYETRSHRASVATDMLSFNKEQIHENNSFSGPHEHSA